MLFYLFPAHAGVIPILEAVLRIALSIPRTRGGDPTSREKYATLRPYSPHTRG